MTNRAAFHRANNAGKPVVSRGKNSIIFDNGDGTYGAVVTIAPLHKGTGPFTQNDEIDTAWQSVAGAWQYEFNSADFLVQARNIFNVGGLFQFTDPISGEWVQFDPQSLNWIDENTSRQQIAIKQAVNAVPVDYILNFPAAYGAGIDFRYEAHTTRLGKFLTIDSPSRLPTPTVQGNTVWFEFEFSLAMSSGVDVYLDGIKWSKTNGVRVKTSNRIEFKDSATGQNILWRLDYPLAIDSEENNTIGEFEVRRQGGPSSLFITIRIPKSWIDSAVFPIQIDPSTVYVETQDFHIITTYPTTGWDNAHDATSGGINSTLTNSYIQSTEFSGGDYQISRASLPFNTGSISSSFTVLSGSVFLYHYQSPDNSDNDGDDFIALVESFVANPLSPANSDYNDIGDSIDNPTEGASRVDLGNVSIGVYSEYILNTTGLTFIHLGSYTQIGFREGHDVLDHVVATGANNRLRWYSANQSGTAQDPYLYVVYGTVLTSTAISTTPVVGTPTLSVGGTDVLDASDISTTPVAGAPTLGQTHALTSTGISTIPIVGTVDIGQTHVLDAVEILVYDKNAFPNLQSPHFHETNILYGVNVSTTPIAATPTFVGVVVLTSVDISATPISETPSIVQVHVLDAADISTTPATGTPSMAGEATLDATNISTTPATGIPTIAQAHALVPIGISTIPTTEASDISQVHVLDAADISTTPVTGTPSMTGEHTLDSVDISTTPVSGTPTIAQQHALVSVVISTTPNVSTATLGQIHILSVVDITANPVLGTPSMTGENALSANGISTVPVLETPDFNQSQALDATDLAVSVDASDTTQIGQTHVLDASDIYISPVLGTPSMSGEAVLSAIGILTTPVTDTTTIGQIHILVSIGIIATSELDAPTIGQTHALSLVGIEALPEVGQPTITHIHVLNATSIQVGTVLDVINVGQIHILDSIGVSTTPVLDVLDFQQVHLLDSLGIVTSPILSFPSWDLVQGDIEISFDALYLEVSFEVIETNVSFNSLLPEVVFDTY